LLMPPEVTGAMQAFRVVRPLLLAIGGTLPVLAARAAAGAGRSALVAAGAAAVTVTIGFALFVAWLWQRDKLQDLLQATVNPTGGGARAPRP